MSEQMKTNDENNAAQTIIIKQEEKKSNGLGTAGFVLALIGLIFGWVPGLGWITWILGLIFSFIAIFKKPRGLAIAGLVISLLGFILLSAVFASFSIASLAF